MPPPEASRRDLEKARDRWPGAAPPGVVTAPAMTDYREAGGSLNGPSRLGASRESDTGGESYPGQSSSTNTIRELSERKNRRPRSRDAAVAGNPTLRSSIVSTKHEDASLERHSTMNPTKMRTTVHVALTATTCSRNRDTENVFRVAGSVFYGDHAS